MTEAAGCIDDILGLLIGNPDGLHMRGVPTGTVPVSCCICQPGTGPRVAGCGHDEVGGKSG